MNAYADYEFYQSTYLGGRAAVITEGFDGWAQKASAAIRQHTLGNIDEGNVPECVKYCCCELAELFFLAENSKAAKEGVISEKVGDLSVSYESAEAFRQSVPRKTRAVIRLWLSDTGLLSTGGRLC